ncbi:MAG TPA: hypothetical protein VFM30_11760 [Steroidobacteraceae bacterium]|nr:hypothetical protein [Steroidobacteraceae bacterium]
MSGDAAIAWRVVERAGPARRVVLRSGSADDDELWVLGGYRGPELPATLEGAKLESLGGGRHRITAAEGRYEFSAEAVDRIAERPGLFEALHRPFRLGGGERLAARALLALLRLPGGAKLLRLWHAGRSR